MYNKARWDEPLRELDGKTVRFAADTLGVEWGRNRMGRNIWINQMRIEIKKHMETGAHVLVDNIRFLDEFELMKQLGAATIAFHRPALRFRGIALPPTERYIPDIQSRCGHSIVNLEGHFAETTLEMRALLKRIIEA
jgi:extradiol dioxygenase family protein